MLKFFLTTCKVAGSIRRVGVVSLKIYQQFSPLLCCVFFFRHRHASTEPTVIQVWWTFGPLHVARKLACHRCNQLNALAPWTVVSRVQNTQRLIYTLSLKWGSPLPARPSFSSLHISNDFNGISFLILVYNQNMFCKGVLWSNPRVYIGQVWGFLV